MSDPIPAGFVTLNLLVCTHAMHDHVTVCLWGSFLSYLVDESPRFFLETLGGPSTPS